MKSKILLTRGLSPCALYKNYPELLKALGL